MFKPSSNFLTGRSKAVLLLWILFIICVSCHTVLSAPCSLVVTCWERADLLALLYVIFSCVFVTFQHGVLCQVLCLIVWIPDLCLLPYFYSQTCRLVIRSSLLISTCMQQTSTLANCICSGGTVLYTNICCFFYIGFCIFPL